MLPSATSNDEPHSGQTPADGNPRRLYPHFRQVAFSITNPAPSDKSSLAWEGLAAFGAAPADVADQRVTALRATAGFTPAADLPLRHVMPPCSANPDRGDVAGPLIDAGRPTIARRVRTYDASPAHIPPSRRNCGQHEGINELHKVALSAVSRAQRRKVGVVAGDLFF